MQGAGEDDCMVGVVVNGDEDEDKVTVHVDKANEQVVVDEDTEVE